MIRNKFLRTILIFLTSAVIAPASSTFASSIFSRYGIGLIQNFSMSGTIGMGGVGIATQSASALPYLNSAALPFVKGTRFDGSLRYESSNINFSAAEGRLADATFNSFQVVFPIKKGYGLGLGLQPYSTVAFRVSKEIQFESTTTSATESLTGVGGLQRAFIHFGGSIGKWLAYGAGMNLYFGDIEKTWRIVPAPTDGSFGITRDLMNTYMSGLGWNAGLILKATDRISLGAVFNFPTSLNTETRTEYSTGRITPEIDGNAKLPFSYGYGFYVAPYGKWQFAGEIYLQRWEKIEARDGFNSATTNTERISAGFGYTPSKKVFDGFFERITYSGGLIFAKLPYLESPTGDDAINERSLTFGMSIPFNLNRGKLDLGIAVGKRGSLANNSAEETFFQFTAAVTGGELWFIRRKR